jgi:hypothetical protein
VADRITFIRDQHGIPTARLEGARFRVLVSWLTTDVQNDPVELLEVLDQVEQARRGRSEAEEWEGNAYAAEISPDGLAIEGFYEEDPPVRYSLEEAHPVLVQYWEFLAPSADDRSRLVAEWEKQYVRVHPDRLHLL